MAIVVAWRRTLGLFRIALILFFFLMFSRCRGPVATVSLF